MPKADTTEADQELFAMALERFNAEAEAARAGFARRRNAIAKSHGVPEGAEYTLEMTGSKATSISWSDPPPAPSGADAPPAQGSKPQ